MQKGFSLPILIVAVLLVMALPAFFWVYHNNYKSPTDSVKGAVSINDYDTKPGLGVIIISGSGNWDLVEYLCTSLEECKASLDSGKKWGTVSGGATDGHEVIIEASPRWESYTHIKYFVKHNWSSEGKYYVKSLGNAPGSEKVELSDTKVTQEVVISPLSTIKDTYYDAAVFSDAQ